MSYNPFLYQAKLEQIVDGDTFYLTIDLGYGLHNTEFKVRLSEVDTAEIYFVPAQSREHRMGEDHLMFVRDWLHDARNNYYGDEYDPDGNWPLIHNSLKDKRGKFRYISDISRKSDGQKLNDALIKAFGKDVEFK